MYNGRLRFEKNWFCSNSQVCADYALCECGFKWEWGHTKKRKLTSQGNCDAQASLPPTILRRLQVSRYDGTPQSSSGGPEKHFGLSNHWHLQDENKQKISLGFILLNSAHFLNLFTCTSSLNVGGSSLENAPHRNFKFVNLG